MIINYPTGLYSNVLPHSPAAGGNVTFTISDSAPPRTNLLFPKLPAGIGYRQHAPVVITLNERRRFLGELIFTTISSGRGTVGSNMAQYELGQVLDFDDPTEPAPTVDMLVAGIDSDVQHNNGLLDYDRLGLTIVQQALVSQTSDSAYREKQAELAAVREQYINLQVVIAENQKLLNEAAKAIAALMVINDPILSMILENLSLKQAQLLAERDAAVIGANIVAATADQLRSELLTLASLVR